MHAIWTESKLKKYTEIYMVPGYYELGRHTCITVYSPLLLAVLRSNEEVASLLLEQNASIFLSGKAYVLIVALVLGKVTMVSFLPNGYVPDLHSNIQFFLQARCRYRKSWAVFVIADFFCRKISLELNLYVH